MYVPYSYVRDTITGGYLSTFSQVFLTREALNAPPKKTLRQNNSTVHYPNNYYQLLPTINTNAHKWTILVLLTPTHTSGRYSWFLLFCGGP